MASLNKLAIRGIRSFDDKSIAVIEFFSPVTVIVGHNGSGKTTIIECLKYATTGDQPPNTRGGAFVHDPKMANEKEVKAQVKLRFHAANGTRMLAVRNLSVTAKKTSGLTMKTLESILSIAEGESDKGKTKQRGTISTKCAEMDIEIPQLLGVSKSVLENVIFCHQEESWWPLAEPAALKKKFDEIFEATKYTKALDSIKSLRKERVSDLKAEKERLNHLATQKAHADKLKRRIADSNRSIAEKEVELEDTKNTYDALHVSNIKFYQYATHFREQYLQVEGLETKKQQFKQQLEDMKLNLKSELSGTDDELMDQLSNFNHTAEASREKQKTAKARHDGLVADQVAANKKVMDVITKQAGLQSEVNAQETRIADREGLIRDIAKQRGIKGYDTTPLALERVSEFSERLVDMRRKQRASCEALQGEQSTKTEEYNSQVRELDAKLSDLKSEKNRLREQMATYQTSVRDMTRKLEDLQAVPEQISTLETEIEDKKAQLTRAQNEATEAKTEQKLRELQVSAKSLEEKREEFNKEITSLSRQADSRAKLDHKRSEVKAKSKEVTKILSGCAVKYRRLVGTDPKAETMETELESLLSEKERECSKIENQSNVADRKLHEEQMSLTNLKAKLSTKKERLRELEKIIGQSTFAEAAAELSERNVKCETMEQIVEMAREEILIATNGITGHEKLSSVYKSLLQTGQTRGVCGACKRGMNEHELETFEEHMKAQIESVSSMESMKEAQETLESWKSALEEFEPLLPKEKEKNELTEEIPDLVEEVEELEEQLRETSSEAEKATSDLSELRKELKDITAMNVMSGDVTRLTKESKLFSDQIASLEAELAATGSAKTVEDVQEELDAVTREIRSNEKARDALVQTRDRQSALIRKYEDEFKSMNYDLRELQGKLREKKSTEDSLEALGKENTNMGSRVKKVDAELEEAQEPKRELDAAYKAESLARKAKIEEAQHLYQEYNMNVDKLQTANKAIERFVREGVERKLQDCIERREDLDTEISEFTKRINEAKAALDVLDLEARSGESTLANLRQNIQVRKIAKQITSTQAEIDAFDMEEAAKARRNFEEKYPKEKEREEQLHSKLAHLGGELSSQKRQLKEWNDDLKEFKDIYKKYTDQLITVKMSDMANNDLEKYAKALDNAIMKYHSLKMEEVNDTMKHLWNKTYQGTDIDGIRIRADSEGGTTKRSYNYRVVMVKDQVEMDMRGRCSAGQKMLASIIIRLALSDSFGQNCGILALDEPTNALDTENIDALASSLVDIINERRGHASFQLIIITHDENFLKKLGQNSVMEHYWRVSRDSRQKSVIERQRFV